MADRSYPSRLLHNSFVSAGKHRKQRTASTAVNVRCDSPCTEPILASTRIEQVNRYRLFIIVYYSLHCSITRDGLPSIIASLFYLLLLLLFRSFHGFSSADFGSPGFLKYISSVLHEVHPSSTSLLIMNQIPVRPC